MADLTGMMQAAAGAAGGGAVDYIEDVFSTYLYTGTGAALTITNDIDLDGEGGLTWIKSRSAATDHQLFDTVRGATNELISNSDAAQAADADTLTAFNADGFSLGADSNVNTSAATYCSWSFRKAPKFFDVVSYTGTGSNTTILHNLGSVPGMIIVKCVTAAEDWLVYHRSVGNTKGLYLNSTTAEVTNSSFWNDTTPTSTVFSLGDNGRANDSGKTYVAYLFAHDAGGFGTSGTDNVISCGSVVGVSGGTTVTLGYEPQFVLVKNATSTQDWWLIDNMRGLVATNSESKRLHANTTQAEMAIDLQPTATGFTSVSMSAGPTYIYMAIRRPMKVPTTGTSVFSPVARTGNATSNTVVTAGFTVDMFWNGIRDFAGEFPTYFDRLRGNDLILFSNATNAEFSTASIEVAFNRSNANTGVQIGTNNNGINGNGYLYVDHFFRRAPGFFDEVCFTGSGAASFNHNLGVAPELMIIKQRATAGNSWGVYSAPTGNTSWLALQSTGGSNVDSTMWNDTTPTSTVFTIGSTSRFSGTCVAYLFASCPGVSKVGSYTGTGATQTIACGFTGGARFVLIKRTDSTGNWWVWDTARGMVTGTDPRLTINDTTVEANNDWVLTTSTGFQIVTSDATVNASGGSYIYLAIA